MGNKNDKNEVYFIFITPFLQLNFFLLLGEIIMLYEKQGKHYLSERSLGLFKHLLFSLSIYDLRFNKPQELLDLVPYLSPYQKEIYNNTVKSLICSSIPQLPPEIWAIIININYKKLSCLRKVVPCIDFENYYMPPKIQLYEEIDYFRYNNAITYDIPVKCKHEKYYILKRYLSKYNHLLYDEDEGYQPHIFEDEPHRFIQS